MDGPSGDQVGPISRTAGDSALRQTITRIEGGDCAEWNSGLALDDTAQLPSADHFACCTSLVEGQVVGVVDAEAVLQPVSGQAAIHRCVVAVGQTARCVAAEIGAE